MYLINVLLCALLLLLPEQCIINATSLTAPLSTVVNTATAPLSTVVKTPTVSPSTISLIENLLCLLQILTPDQCTNPQNITAPPPKRTTKATPPTTKTTPPTTKAIRRSSTKAPLVNDTAEDTSPRLRRSRSLADSTTTNITKAARPSTVTLQDTGKFESSEIGDPDNGQTDFESTITDQDNGNTDK
ncbi:UNVERIFIED_CONTAM: hypothetical protein RMT77_015257 [Armadillidium vulgare]